METEPIYTFEITEHDHTYKSGLVKKAKKFVGMIIGSFNGNRIVEKTEIYNRPFFEQIEKDRLYKRYYKKVEDYKIYSTSKLK